MPISIQCSSASDREHCLYSNNQPFLDQTTTLQKNRAIILLFSKHFLFLFKQATERVTIQQTSEYSGVAGRDTVHAASSVLHSFTTILAPLITIPARGRVHSGKYSDSQVRSAQEWSYRHEAASDRYSVVRVRSAPGNVATTMRRTRLWHSEPARRAIPRF